MLNTYPDIYAGLRHRLSAILRQLGPLYLRRLQPAVAWFSRPTRLSSSRSARVILIRRLLPAMAHLTDTFLGISPILQRQLEEGGEHARRVFSVNFYLGCGVGTIPAPK